MRMGEECPYITPCGFCSRQGKPCDYKRQLNQCLSEMRMQFDNGRRLAKENEHDGE